MARLSKKQLTFLQEIAASELPSEDFPEGVPFYTNRFHMEFDFHTESERERWYTNLETRGLVTRKKRCFFRLTDAGRAAIAAQAGKGVQ